LRRQQPADGQQVIRLQDQIQAAHQFVAELQAQNRDLSAQLRQRATE